MASKSEVNQTIKTQGVIESIQSAGYRNGFLPEAMKKITLIAAINSFVTLMLIVSITVVYMFRPSPESFAVSPDGRVTKLIPLSDDITSSGEISQAALSDYVGRTIIDAYSIDFVNWREQLSRLSSSFTPDGYNSFMVAIEPIKDRVVEGRYVTKIGLITPAIIEKSGVISGIRKYKIGMDIMISFESQTKRIDPQKWHVEIIAQRVPFSVNPVGIAINSAVASVSTAQ